MLSVCICDDEQALCRELRNMLAQYSGHEEMAVFEINSIPEPLETTFSYDVLFLDISFDGEDAGIEGAKQHRRKSNEAIIVIRTALSGYAPNG